MKNINTLVKFCNYLCFLFINGNRNFSMLAILPCPAVHILSMAILGGWVSDRLMTRGLFELVAATQCTFL